MKKLKIIMAIMLGFSFCLMVGCAKNGDNVSELRESIYKANSSSFHTVAYSGKRETNYKIDGVCNKTQDYFVIVVEGVFASEPVAKLTIGEKELEQKGAKHPFNNEYVFEFGVKVIDNQIKVTLLVDGKSEEISYEKVVIDGFLSADEAIAKASEELGVKQGEIIARMIENPTKNDGTYFWYVAFCKSESEIKSVLIDASGTVVAKKTS